MRGLSCVLFVVAFITVASLGFVLFAYEKEYEAQELLLMELEDKISNGYVVLLDGRKVSSAEEELIVNNIRWYEVVYDDENKEAIVTKRPLQLRVFPVPIVAR